MESALVGVDRDAARPGLPAVDVDTLHEAGAVACGDLGVGSNAILDEEKATGWLPDREKIVVEREGRPATLGLTGCQPLDGKAMDGGGVEGAGDRLARLCPR